MVNFFISIPETSQSTTNSVSCSVMLNSDRPFGDHSHAGDCFYVPISTEFPNRCNGNCIVCRRIVCAGNICGNAPNITSRLLEANSSTTFKNTAAELSTSSKAVMTYFLFSPFLPNISITDRCKHGSALCQSSSRWTEEFLVVPLTLFQWQVLPHDNEQHLTSASKTCLTDTSVLHASAPSARPDLTHTSI